MYDTQFSAKVRSKAGDAHHTQESFFYPFFKVVFWDTTGVKQQIMCVIKVIY